MPRSDGSPVVLVPGLGCSPRLYAEQIPALRRYGPVTVADHTHGDSIQAIACAILEAAPPHFALGGLSLGGYVAFEIMRQAPQRVAKLALLDTLPAPETPLHTLFRLVLLEMAKNGRFAEAIDKLFPGIVHPSRRDDAAIKRIIDLMADETGPELFVRHQYAVMARPDSRPLLPTIKCPTLVLVGDSDKQAPPTASREMADAIPNARLVVVPACGHMSTIERPAAVNRAMLDWLQD
jgi:pimeloyl-ACP methyl ester carboxylesterase